MWWESINHTFLPEDSSCLIISIDKSFPDFLKSNGKYFEDVCKNLLKLRLIPIWFFLHNLILRFIELSIKF